MRWHDLKHYRGLFELLVQFGRLETRKNPYAGADFNGEATVAPVQAAQADEVARKLEALGPCYIKLGQFLSSRSDLLPGVMLTSLSRLQDQVQPFGYDQTRHIVETELGTSLSEAFMDFDPQPLASASLSQVHRATLRDGRQAAVKVQRPDIHERIYKDIAQLQRVAALVDRTTQVGKRLHTQEMLEEFKKVIVRELDFRIEAAQITALRNNLQQFESIVLPEAFTDYSSGRVLTMSFIAGQKINELDSLKGAQFDGTQLADDLFGVYLHQVLIDGMFHADPHPGNILITDDHKIALIDLGMVSILAPNVQIRLLKFLSALNAGDGRGAGTQLLALSAPAYDFNQKAYFQRMNTLMGKYHGFSVKPLHIGRMVMDIIHVSTQCGLVLPTQLTLLAKTMFHLDQVGRALNPHFDPNRVIRSHMRKILRHKMRRTTSMTGVLDTLFETKELAALAPQRMNALLSKLADNDLSFRVDMLDEKYLMTGIQKIANRLTTGVILAALIVGAALMMRVRTDFTLLGYPGLAIIFFLVAGFGGVILIFNILFQDESSRKK